MFNVVENLWNKSAPVIIYNNYKQLFPLQTQS